MVDNFDPGSSLGGNNGNGNGNGHGSANDTLEGEEITAYMNLTKQNREDMPLIATMGKAQSGVLVSMLNFPDEINSALMISDIESLDARDDIVSAITERLLVGASLSAIKTYLAATCGTNKKGRWNNRVSLVGDTMSHQKITTNTPRPSRSSRNSISD